jgi:hypothetical protein
MILLPFEELIVGARQVVLSGMASPAPTSKGQAQGLPLWRFFHSFNRFGQTLEIKFQRKLNFSLVILAVTRGTDRAEG